MLCARLGEVRIIVSVSRYRQNAVVGVFRCLHEVGVD